MILFELFSRHRSLKLRMVKSDRNVDVLPTGASNQQQSVEFRPPKTSNFGLNSEVPFRDSRALNEGVDMTNGINFSEDDGEPL